MFVLFSSAWSFRVEVKLWRFFLSLFGELEVVAKFPFAMGPKNSLDGPVVRVMVFNATFNNISAIWWRSIL